MFFDTGSLTTCLYITVLVLMLVVMMSAIDTLICRKLGLNLMGGVSENPKADLLMKIRSILVALVFFRLFDRCVLCCILFASCFR